MIKLSSPPIVVPATEEARVLASQLGVSVEVKGRLGKQFVFVEPHGASPLTVLHGLATALHGSVTPTATGYLIERTKADVDEMRRRRTERRIAWLSKTFHASDDYRTRFGSTTNPQAAFAAAEKAEIERLESFSKDPTTKLDVHDAIELLPSSVLLEDLCKRIGLATLAAIPSPGSLVFEDSPVARAISLPPHEDLLEKYERGTDKLGVGALTGDLQQRMAHRGYGSEVLAELARASHAVSRLRLEVRSHANMIYLMLEGYDEKGDRVFITGASALSGGQLRISRLILAEALGKPGGLADNQIVPLSPAASETRRYVVAEGSQPVPGWISDPVHQEPLNQYVAEALSALASEAPEKCVVMATPDQLWSDVGHSILNGNLIMPALEETLREFDPMEQVSSSDCTVWRSIDPEAQEAVFADRKELANFVKRASAAKRVTLRDTAVLTHDASTFPDGLTDLWPMSMAKAPNMPSIQGLLAIDNFWLALLGAVRGDDWDRLLAGQKISIAQLGVDKEFETLLRFDRGAQCVGDKPFPDIFRHPLELFPNEEFGDAKLSVRYFSEPVTRIWKVGAPEADGWGSGDATKLGYGMTVHVMWIHDQPRILMREEDYFSRLEKDLYRRGKMSKIQWTIELPLGLRLETTATLSVDPDPDVFSFKQLTQDQKDAIWNQVCAWAIDAARQKRASGSGPALGGSGVTTAPSGGPPPARRVL